MDYKKPKIAILLAAPDNNFIRVDKRNSEAVIRAGGIPLHITPDRIDEQLEELRPAGLLLPGGNFPIPDEYYTDKSAYQDEQPERVAAYFTMVEWSKKNNVCLLGICAGMQILAAALGGKLSSGISGH
ncbi:MAG: gamma-glutamyl-gamma-aminobutyrate hydrolase family protein, partial [Rickettsiales bacterium]|nr:gamma-glutamyl-gamma-aminobutyrate hydrolase family protein [Rickettsiales bacterium]